MKICKISMFSLLTGSAARVFALVLAGAGFVINAYAADGTGTANATVVIPIAIANSSPHLRFGSFSTTASGQTVAISTAGVRTLTGTLGVGNGQNAFGAASFAVTGEPSLTYAITLPSTSQAIVTGGATAPETMQVTAFVSNPSGTGTLSGGGAQTLLVGATVTTVASQVAGVYTGNFTVTVNYN